MCGNDSRYKSVHKTSAKIIAQQPVPDRDQRSGQKKNSAPDLSACARHWRQRLGWVALCNLLLITQVQAVSFCDSNGGAGWPITDNATTSTTVSVNMGTAVGPVLDVNVSTTLTHTWVGDLDASVTAPGGGNVVLFDRPGVPATANGCNGDNLNVVFDDEAASASNIENLCGAGVPTIAGTYRPHNPANPLSGIDLTAVNGTWTIAVRDNATADTGTVNQVCVDIQAAAITLVRRVSTLANCADQTSSLTVPAGVNVYVCDTVTNSGTASFTLAAGATVDSLGASLAGLEGSYAPGASLTVNTGPYVAGGAQLPTGTTSVNSQVTASGATTGLPLTPVATASVSVQSTPVAASGNKPIYLNGTSGLSRSKPTASSSTNIGNGTSQIWTLTPALGKTLSFTNTSIPVVLRLSKPGAGTQARTFNLAIAATGTTTGAIGSLNNITLNLNGTSTESSFSVPVTGLTSLAAGSQITLTLTNNSGGGRNIKVDDTDTVASFSQLVLNATTVINVDSVTAYDAAYPAGIATPGTIAGGTVYLRAVVSDPFGDYDITSARFDVIDSSGTLRSSITQTLPVTETPVNDPTLAIFEYAYTVPASPSGTWTVWVTANEGSEGTVSHAWSGKFAIGTPSLSILKSASTPRTVSTLVNSGEDVTYTLQISNTGIGAASAVTISEAISAYLKFCTNCRGGLPFSLVDGSPASGVSLGTASYTDRLGAAYLPGAGYDANIGGVALPLNGYLPPGTSFSLIYQAQTQ